MALYGLPYTAKHSKGKTFAPRLQEKIPFAGKVSRTSCTCHHLSFHQRIMNKAITYSMQKLENIRKTFAVGLKICENHESFPSNVLPYTVIAKVIALWPYMA